MTIPINLKSEKASSSKINFPFERKKIIPYFSHLINLRQSRIQTKLLLTSKNLLNSRIDSIQVLCIFKCEIKIILKDQSVCIKFQ